MRASAAMISKQSQGDLILSTCCKQHGHRALITVGVKQKEEGERETKEEDEYKEDSIDQIMILISSQITDTM